MKFKNSGIIAKSGRLVSDLFSCSVDKLAKFIRLFFVAILLCDVIIDKFCVLHFQGLPQFNGKL